LIFGAPEDKNVAGMLSRLVPLADHIIMTTANHPRSASPEELAHIVAEMGKPVSVTSTVAEAVTSALAAAEPGDLIVAAGSIIVIGDLLNHWDTLQSDLTYG
jgi:dihydrofolate synthase/folylpolyglutamate synthase